MAKNALIQGKGRAGSAKLQQLQASIRHLLSRRLEPQTLFDHLETAVTCVDDPLGLNFALDEIYEWQSLVDEMAQLEDDTAIDIGDVFTAGAIPICYSLEGEEPVGYQAHEGLTYALWRNLRIEDIYSRVDHISEAHPAVVRVVKDLCARINDAMRNGLWNPAEINENTAFHHEVTHNEGGETWIFVQFVDLWRITNVDYDTSMVNEQGNYTYDLTVSPCTAVGGLFKSWVNSDGDFKVHNLKGLRDSSPFLPDNHGPESNFDDLIVNHLCRFDLPMASEKAHRLPSYEGRIPPGVGDVLLHFPAEGQYERLRQIAITTTVESFHKQNYYHWVGDPHDDSDFFLDMQRLTDKASDPMWTTEMEDYGRKGGYDEKSRPTFRTVSGITSNPYRDYGEWTERRGSTGFDEGTRFMYPHERHAEEDALSRLWEVVSSGDRAEVEDEDDEWGRSSRFVQAWKDKRKLKLIDKTNGETPHWSDVIRCTICNGQVKVLLKKITTRLIFDCPHCGEAGSVDGSHLSEGAVWPADKKRKVVDAK